MLVEAAIGALIEITTERGFNRLSRNEIIIKALRKIGYNPKDLPRDFDGLYTYSLIHYGSTKPPQLIKLFRIDPVIDIFNRAFEDNELSIILDELNNILDWYEDGEILRRIDIAKELGEFNEIFNKLVDRSRQPQEIKRDHRLNKIEESIATLPDEIEKRLQYGENSLIQQRSYTQDPNLVQIFVGSSCTSLRDIRSVILEPLKTNNYRDIFVHENILDRDPSTVLETSSDIVRNADIYIGLFDSEWDEIAARTLEIALYLKTQHIVYIRSGVEKDLLLREFLESVVYPPTRNVNYKAFINASDLLQEISNDVHNCIDRSLLEHKVNHMIYHE